jgi:hypothetical protein
MRFMSKNKYSDLYIIYINSEHANYAGRKNLMNEKLTGLDLPYERFGVPVVAGVSTVNTVSGAHRDVAKMSIENNLLPVLLLEDDVDFLYSFPYDLEIEPSAKLTYLGLSLYNGGQGRLILKPYDDSYFRCFNSLAAHAMILSSEESAEYYIDLCERSIEKNTWHDKELAYDSHNNLFLTPKTGPVFYQNDGHTKPVTKFDIKDFIMD